MGPDGRHCRQSRFRAVYRGHVNSGFIRQARLSARMPKIRQGQKQNQVMSNKNARKQGEDEGAQLT